MRDPKQLRQAPLPLEDARRLQVTLFSAAASVDVRARGLQREVEDLLQGRFEVIAEAELVDRIDHLRQAGTGVYLVDDSVGTRDVARVLRTLQDVNPRSAQIVLTEGFDPDLEARYRGYGASDVLLWDDVLGRVDGVYHLYRAMRSALERSGLLDDLKSMRDRFHFAWRKSPSPYFRIEAGGAIIGCNQPFAELLGYQSVSELLGKPLLEQSPSSSDAPPEAVPFRAGPGQRRGVRLCTKAGDGVEVDVIDHEAPGTHLEYLRIARLGGPDYRLPIREGYVDSLGGAHTQLKRRLSRYESVYGSLFGAMAQGFIVADARGRISTCNPAAEALIGIRLDAVYGQHLDQVLRPVSSESGRIELFSQVYDGEERVFELRRPTDDSDSLDSDAPDESVWVRVKALMVEIPGRSGNFLSSRYLISLLDETARVGAERKARQAEFDSAMASGVSHDMRNFLTAIASSASLMKGMLRESDPTLYEYAEQIERVALGSAGVLNQGVRLARSRSRSAEPRRPTDVDSVLRGIDRLLESVVSQRIDLHWDLGANEAKVRTVGGAVEQIVINLILNARQAMSNGGRITLRTRVENLEEDNAWGVAAGPYVTLSVADDGPGISEQVRLHMYEPFYTTREEGTGLGLSMVRRLVHSLDGEILCVSEVGEGTDFRVALPLVHQVAENVESAEPVSLARPG